MVPPVAPLPLAALPAVPPSFAPPAASAPVPPEIGTVALPPVPDALVPPVAPLPSSPLPVLPPWSLPEQPMATAKRLASAVRRVPREIETLIRDLVD